MATKQKVADRIADFLERKNIRHVFGIVGAGNAHIFDAIGRKGFTEIVCVHHEQAATMAMQTYFRTRGEMTAALVTTGGGSANALTGVISAWMDSMPGLVISGNEASRHTGANPLRVWGVQGFASSEMVSGVTKYSTRIVNASLIDHELDKAYHISTSGRPGPVWLDVPMDIQGEMVDPDQLVKFVPPQIVPTVDENDVDRLINLFSAAKRPVLWLGQGIRLSGALPQLVPLLESLGAPALISWNGVDMVESDHRLLYGRAGVYGQRCANFVLQNADLVVALGTRLAIPQIGYDLTELAREAKFAVIDIDPTEVMKLRPRVTLPICADAGAVMTALLSRLKSTELPHYDSWISRCDAWRERYPWVGPEHEDRHGFINSYRFMDRLSDAMKDDQIVVTDMGTALLSGFQALRIAHKQRLMTSTGLGEMGFGLPAAIGASFGRDRGEVLCLNCDGGMMMNLQELQTIVHHELPIKIIVFNNDGYLMIKHTQKSLFKGNYVGSNQCSGVTCPDYSKIAAAFGLPAYQIRTWSDFDSVIPAILDAQGPLICEVFMDPEQYFFPKLSVAQRKDGTLVSPPLEDLSPLLPRDELRENMLIGLHPKSEELG